MKIVKFMENLQKYKISSIMDAEDMMKLWQSSLDFVNDKDINTQLFLEANVNTFLKYTGNIKNMNNMIDLMGVLRDDKFLEDKDTIITSKPKPSKKKKTVEKNDTFEDEITNYQEEIDNDPMDSKASTTISHVEVKPQIKHEEIEVQPKPEEVKVEVKKEEIKVEPKKEEIKVELPKKETTINSSLQHNYEEMTSNHVNTTFTPKTTLKQEPKKDALDNMEL